MLADADSEVLMHGTEHGDVRLPLSASERRVGVRASERRDEVDPPQEPEHLHEPGEDAEVTASGTIPVNPRPGRAARLRG